MLPVKNELREKELNAERERNELERQKNELREKELAADAEQRELRKAELIMQECLEREKNGTAGTFGASKISLRGGQTPT